MTNCLIVDDNDANRNATRHICEASGLKCEEAENGLEALYKCRSQMPDIVLMDWDMPGMNGIDCTIAVREIKDGGKPIILLCTAENDLEHIQSALDAGANEILIKPLEMGIMRGKFERMGLLMRDTG